MGHRTRSMRFVWFRNSPRCFGPRERLLAQTLLALLGCLLLAGMAFGQGPAHPINPHQIGWPTCPAGSTVYNIVSGQCQANGTAANPAGASGQLQANCSSAFCGVGATDINGSSILNINTQMNVQSFGAKGDCSTDDHNAIIAAQTAAQAYAVANSQPAVLYFPKPPGGCYLTSTILWTGVSFVGQPGGNGVNSPHVYNVTIKGKPGQDILATPDPSVTGSYTWNPSWTIRDISLLVDNSVTNIHPHRWPGRWFDDGAITSGSAVFTSSRAQIGCSDIGQHIQINGAGVAGAPLLTTIANVDPCWSNFGSTGAWKKVTLAAAASTTVTNAHSYISVLDLPIATNIGNCAIAMDNVDALASDWPNPSAPAGSLESTMSNVAFNTTNGAVQASATCGIFTQGAWSLYNFTADHISFNSEIFSVVDSAPSEINSFNSGFGDFQDWSHLSFVTDYYPWISYNGGESKFRNVEVTALAGPQFMTLSNSFFDVAGWDIELQEMETWALISADSRYGLRTTGQGFHIQGEMSISADANNHAWIDGVDTSCPLTCFADAGGINLYGYGNSVQNATGAPLVNKGKGNTATRYYDASFPRSTPAPSPTVLIPQKGVPNLLAGIEPDFANDGFPGTPYRHEDLFLTPQDIFSGTAGTDTWSNLYQDDANSLTGGELFFHTGFNFNVFQPFESTNPGCPGCLTLGTNFPLAQGTLYVSLKCATATTTAINFNSTGGTNNNQSLSCSTTNLQTYAIPFDFRGSTGNIGIKNNGSTGQDFWLAWAVITIAPNIPTGSQIGSLPIAAGTKTSWTLSTTAVAANTCTAQTPVTVPGLTASSSLTWNPSADYSAVTGFSPSGSSLYFVAWPTTNTINWKVCNASASPITPGSGTAWNVGVIF